MNPDETTVTAAQALLDDCETAADIARQENVPKSTARDWVADLKDHVDLEWDPAEQAYEYDTERLEQVAAGGFETAEPAEPAEAADPTEADLSRRQEYIVRRVASDSPSLSELSDDLGVDERFVTAHLRDIREKGWQIYVDESSEAVGLEGDHTLRSSEHTGTRTRKANQWWELSHSQLVREFRSLESPTTEVPVTESGQDLVLHLTDVHMGDKVRDDSGDVVYSPDTAVDVVDYVTEKFVALADRHSDRVDVDTVHLLWGGDFLTNEAIYDGQFEDLSAWLDEQHERMVPPLLRQVKTLSERFPAVNVVCKTGNHGEHRASGKSKQANADLILYKSVRNAIAAVRDHSDADFLDNVAFQIGEASNFKDFDLRGGRLTGHLRHGQDRKAGFRTSAAVKEWSQTLLQHEFDVAWMGHVHRQQQFSVNGRPVFVSGSPKPSGDFAEKIAAGPDMNLATMHGVSNQGITFVYPIDARGFNDQEP